MVELFKGKMAEALEIRDVLRSDGTDRVLYQDKSGNLFRPGPETHSEDAAHSLRALLNKAGRDHHTEVNGHITIWTAVKTRLVAAEGEQDE